MADWDAAFDVRLGANTSGVLNSSRAQLLPGSCVQVAVLCIQEREPHFLIIVLIWPYFCFLVHSGPENNKEFLARIKDGHLV